MVMRKTTEETCCCLAGALGHMHTASKQQRGDGNRSKERAMAGSSIGSKGCCNGYNQQPTKTRSNKQEATIKNWQPCWLMVMSNKNKNNNI